MSWKNELVTIRVTPAQKAAYMALAASKGMSLSELIRERLEAGEPSAESAAAPAAPPPRPSPASNRRRLAAGEGSAIDGALAQLPRVGSPSRAGADDQASPAANRCTADTPAGTRCKLCKQIH